MSTLRRLVFLCIILPVPLFAKLPTTVEGETQRSYWQFLFLFESTTAPGQREFVIRPIIPIYSSYRNDEKAYTFTSILYPIYYSHGTNQWSRWSLFYFFSGDDRAHTDTDDDTDLLLTPLFAWGRGDTERERYVSFFPFYGRIRNKL
ncbi:MAG: hypothetical protein HY042_09640, partial [Spirochaetia bacterium]|nr:hypothetical protein [Spirochaetia bacterium]